MIVSWQLTLVLMLLAHFFADYTLQGWLADGKQKAWWKKQLKDLESTKYKFDYLMALACHSMYWAILICLPFYASPYFLHAIVVNSVVHAVVDDQKCNRFKLNLIEDQLWHFVQIGLTFMLLMV